jgi:hypothetical protein
LEIQAVLPDVDALRFQKPVNVTNPPQTAVERAPVTGMKNLWVSRNLSIRNRIHGSRVNFIVQILCLYISSAS